MLCRTVMLSMQMTVILLNKEKRYFVVQCQINIRALLQNKGNRFKTVILYFVTLYRTIMLSHKLDGVQNHMEGKEIKMEIKVEVLCAVRKNKMQVRCSVCADRAVLTVQSDAQNFLAVSGSRRESYTGFIISWCFFFFGFLFL